ncbi:MULTISPECIES: carbonic anhydrase [Saccharopolyspora]|uniref:carbonic anhydrase n=1 Tax=Saccharopolyspora flava TaxID=95161 RepID=A0A1I6UTR8_9PSEU|nr:carbonic anhydrase [Saccharopolyspora flava]SFT04780.1 Carbonic anhydrase [Saccharopolyspora flava]
MLAGVDEFQRTVAPKLRGLFEDLAGGQAPSQLFITCADSRIVPHLITTSGSGDLFIVRNVGNLVPQHHVDPTTMGIDHSVAAAIEYATEVLEVTDITVCGHSGCGAIRALMDGHGENSPTTGLDAWLQHGTHTLARYRVDTTSNDEHGSMSHENLCRANVAQQLDNLLTYPGVRERVDNGALQLTGMYFDIGAAEVQFLDEATGQFTPTGQLTPRQLTTANADD